MSDTLKVQIVADTSGFDSKIGQSARELDNFSDQIKSADKSANKFGSVMAGIAQGVGQSIAGMAVSAGAALLQFGMDSVSAASDLNETLSKTDVLFGDVSDTIKEWSQTTATAFGQSQQQALDAATTFAVFGQAAGVTGDELVEFSTSLSELASDLASFGNTTPEQAIEAIGAALRGESEPLRAYGVLLSDATIKARALSMGLVNAEVDASRDMEQAGLALEKVLGGQVEDLTAQQKLLATQAEIFAQTTAAQGDFARTSGGLANQQRILDAQMQDLSTTIGSMFLPAWLAIVTAVNTFVQATLPPLQNAIDGQIVPAFNAFGAVLASVFGPAIAVISDVLAGFGQGIMTDAIEPLNFFNGWIGRNMPRIQQIVSTVLGAIASFWEAHGQTIVDVVDTYLGWVFNNFEFILRTLLNVVEFVLSVLTGDFENAGLVLRAIIGDWKLWITSGIQGIVDTVVSIWTETDWGAVGSAIIQGIGSGILAMMSWITNLASTVSGAVVDSFKSLLGISSPSKVAAEEIGMPFAEGISQGMRQAMSAVNQTVSGVVGDMVASPAQSAIGAGAGLGNVTINQYFSGNVDSEMVRQAARGGVASALRAIGG
jgi:phage-related protein